MLGRRWFIRRKKVAKKLSKWCKNMYIKIKTKKDIGWDKLIL
jgi:hypothetical protein